MAHTMAVPSFLIGWDVGGWNCDKNPKSRDAIVIIDHELNLIGTPWRGNLRTTINESQTTDELLSRLFALCKQPQPDQVAEYVMGIDTPLGFSLAFHDLLNQQKSADSIGHSNMNPYLYRQTERFLFEHGLSPLSAIKDMIGSQATKGMHLLAKFAPEPVSCGIWSDRRLLTAFEAYPSACKQSSCINALRQKFSNLGHDDLNDALCCALIAYLLRWQPEKLAHPDQTVARTEGWIWVPADTLINRQHDVIVAYDEKIHPVR